MSGREGHSYKAEMRKLPNGAFVHESAYVDDDAVLGAGTRVWHFCHVMARCDIGAGCSLGQNVVVMPHVRLGRNVKVQNNVSLYEGVACEDDVFLGPCCVFTNVKHPRAHVARKDAFERTLLCRGASIGANATAVCGVTLGEHALIAAGAVVTPVFAPVAPIPRPPGPAVGWLVSPRPT